MATEPVLSELNSYSGVDVAVVDSQTAKVLKTFEVPKATSITLFSESDLSELSRYMEELRQCVTPQI